MKNSITADISRESSKKGHGLWVFSQWSHPSQETTLQKPLSADRVLQLLMNVVIILLLTLP